MKPHIHIIAAYSDFRHYNCSVHSKRNLFILLFLCVLIATTCVPVSAESDIPAEIALSGDVTAFDLIIAMNTLRTSYGLAALVEDPIIDAVAQSTAEIMAANQMSWHIGDVPGRLAASGYGGGAKVFGTENFAMGNMSIDEIMVVWSDASHMIPAVNPAYCNVGAGVAKSPNGMTYYVLQAAYTGSKSCGEYKSPTGSTTSPTGTTLEGGRGIIVPVKIATPDSEGKIFHVVAAGQSFWSIAVAYQITIKDLEIWNNLSSNSKLQIGQRLFIPNANTSGYATPTPIGMILVSQPETDGRIIHVVQVYQTLSAISKAYNVPVEKILSFNGIKIDWPLQVGQKLLIRPSLVTPSPTPLPLSPIEKLTPAADGSYFHIITSGETLSGIADLYKIPVDELAAWNQITSGDIIRAGQKLLLKITPPATITPTPLPPTPTNLPSQTQNPPTPTETVTPQPTSTAQESGKPGQNNTSPLLYIAGSVLAVGTLLAIFALRSKRGA